MEGRREIKSQKAKVKCQKYEKKEEAVLSTACSAYRSCISF
jgi:hypothetical protein